MKDRCWRKLIIIWIAIVWGLIATVGLKPVCSQTRSDSQITIAEKCLPATTFTFLDWDEQGQLRIRVHEMHFFEWFPFQRWLTLLPEVQMELELTESQKKELTDLADRLQNRFVKIREDYPKAPHSPESQPFCSQLYEEGVAESQEILLPIQRERLEEVRLRLFLRTRGILGFLKVHQKSLGLEITDSQWDELDQLMQRFKTVTLSEMREICQQQQDEVLDVLTVRQRKLLEQRFVAGSDWVGPDIYLAQLRLAADLETLSGPGASQQRLLDYFAHCPTFMTRLDGCFEARVPTGPPAAFWDLEFANFISRTTSQKFPLPEEDLLVMQQRYGIFRTANGRNYQKYVDDMEAAMSEAQKVQAAKDHQSASQELQQRWMDDFFEGVSTEGQQAFMDYYTRKVQRSCGQVATVLLGIYQEELQLTEAQQEEIRRLCKSAIEPMEKKLQEVERDLFRDLFKIIGDSNQKKLQEALGAPLKHVVPNLAILAVGAGNRK